MKYIDADKLLAEIERRKKQDITFRERNILIDIEMSITSLQQEQPSLPSNLDEAAEEEANRWGNESFLYHNWLSYCFKAGAEWMAGQGVTTEQVVGRTPLNGPNGITVFLYDFDGFKAGDKVVVQIRKK